MQTKCLVLSTSSKRSLNLTTLKIFEVVKNGKSSQGNERGREEERNEKYINKVMPKVQERDRE